MLCCTNFSMLTICCKCRFPIQISSEIFIHWVKKASPMMCTTLEHQHLLWKPLTYFTVTQRLFDESSWHFQETYIWTSATSTSTMWLWISINVVSMATYLQYSVKFSHILQHNSKTIQSIFMKFSGKIDIVLSFTYSCIVTMSINQCGFHSNIFTIFCQISYIF